MELVEPSAATQLCGSRLAEARPPREHGFPGVARLGFILQGVGLTVSAFLIDPINMAWGAAAAILIGTIWTVATRLARGGVVGSWVLAVQAGVIAAAGGLGSFLAQVFELRPRGPDFPPALVLLALGLATVSFAAGILPRGRGKG